MPTIFFYGPKLDKEKGTEMIKSFTETDCRLTGIEKSEFVVYLRESSHESEIKTMLDRSQKIG